EDVITDLNGRQHRARRYPERLYDRRAHDEGNHQGPDDGFDVLPPFALLRRFFGSSLRALLSSHASVLSLCLGRGSSFRDGLAGTERVLAAPLDELRASGNPENAKTGTAHAELVEARNGFSS